MTILLLSHWLTVLVSLALGILVFATNTRRIVNQFFLLVSGVLALWLTFLGLGFLSRDEQFVTAMVRWSCGTAAFVPFLFNILRQSMAHTITDWRGALRHNLAWFSAALLASLLCHSPWFVLGVRSSDVPSPSLVPEPVYDWGIHVFGAYLFITLALLVRGFFRDIRRCERTSRLELQFTVLGCGIGIFFGVCAAVLIPVISGSSQSAQLLPFSVIALDGITAYGIATRRIMDVAHVLRRLTAYALLVSYLVLLYLITWWVADRVGGLLDIQGDFIPHLLAALVAALAMAPASGRMQQFATRLFVNLQSIDLTETVQKANHILSSIATRADLLDQFAALVAQSLGTDRVLILLAEDGEFRQRYPQSVRIPPIRLPPTIPCWRPCATTGSRSWRSRSPASGRAGGAAGGRGHEGPAVGGSRGDPAGVRPGGRDPARPPPVGPHLRRGRAARARDPEQPAGGGPGEHRALHAHPGQRDLQRHPAGQPGQRRHRGRGGPQGDGLQPRGPAHHPPPLPRGAAPARCEPARSAGRRPAGHLR
jgi:hypothetical protein